MKNLIFRKHALKASYLAIVAGLMPGLAMGEQLAIEEVVVTARKKSENLQEVPIAITAFTRSTINRAGIERPQDFIALTPNVSIVDTANAGDTQVTIRGITSTRDAEGTFAYVVDGVLVTNPNGFNGELYNIEQIEVLKGPQGALYGRNAVAGAIIVNTRKPADEFGGELMLGAGSDELIKARLSVEGPITDNLKGSLSVSSREDDGQYENDFTGQDDEVDFLEEKNIRGRLIWEPTDKLTLDAIASYRDVEAGAINFNAVFALPVGADLLDPNLYKDVNDHDFNYFFNVPGENEQENTSFSLKADYDLEWATLTTVVAYDNLEEYLLSDGTSAAFGLYSFDFGAAPDLVGPNVGPAQTACSQSYGELDASLFGANDPFYAFGGDVPGIAGDISGLIGIPGAYGLNALLPPYSSTTCDGYQYQQRDQESTSIEVRLASDSSGQLNWMGGFYYAEIEREVAVSYGADLGDGYFGRKPYVEDRTDLLFWDDFDTEVIAVFASIDYDINDEHTISVAGRYDEEDRDVSNNVPNVLSSNNFGGGSPLNPAYDGSLTDSIPDRDDSYSHFQPKVSWRWSFSDDASMYASYGVGFRSGGFNNLGSSALVEAAFGGLSTRPQNLQDDYDKEVSTSYELGLKSEWMDQRVRLNAAVFHTEVEDSQFFNFLAGGFGILRVVTNIDEVTIQGAELDFQALVTDNFTFYGALGLIDSEIDENKNRPYTEGNEAPLTPEMTANLGVQWVQPVTERLDLVARLDWEYVGDTWFSTVQEETTENAFTDLNPIYQVGNGGIGDAFGVPPGVPADGFIGFGPSTYDKGKRDAYDLLNLRVSLEADSWTLTAWGKNILDEEYPEEIIPAPEFGGYFVHPSKGEAYGVDVVYRF